MSKYRSGLVPTQSYRKVPFEITTEQVEEFIQKKIDIGTSILRSNGRDIPEIKISVHSIQMTRSFAPFYLLLSTDALNGSNKKQKNKNKQTQKELDIFSGEPDERSSSTKIYPEIYEIVRRYLYGREDIKSMHRNRNNMKPVLTTELINRISGASKLKIQRFGDKSFVAVAIDPLKVFIDMLCEDYQSISNRNFIVWIEKIKKINMSNYKYYVTREITEKERSFGNGMSIAQMAQKLFR